MRYFEKGKQPGPFIVQPNRGTQQMQTPAAQLRVIRSPSEQNKRDMQYNSKSCDDYIVIVVS